MATKLKKFIGVIDSGVGGLTVVNDIKKTCSYDIMYVADHAYCPYGEKDPQRVLERLKKLTRYLEAEGAKAIVLACNTASTQLTAVKSGLSVPVFDVIEPTCRKISKMRNVKRAALLATEATVKSKAYQSLLKKSGVDVVAFDCSSLVPFAENNDTASLSAKVAAHITLKCLPFSQADAVVFGCTHFPLLKTLIEPYCLGAEIIYSSCELPEEYSSLARKARIEYFTTGCVSSANASAKSFKNVKFARLDV